MKKLFSIIVGVVVFAIASSYLYNNYLSEDVQKAKNDESTAQKIVDEINEALSLEENLLQIRSRSLSENYSCYVSERNKDLTSQSDSAKAVTGAAPSISDWKVDNGNKTSGAEGYLSGCMNGVTITFQATVSDTGEFAYVLDEAIMNAGFSDDAKTAQTRTISGIAGFDKNYFTASLKAVPNIYQRLKTVFGSEIIIESVKYRKADLTIFIGLPDGGDPVVYWQHSGKNIKE